MINRAAATIVLAALLMSSVQAGEAATAPAEPGQPKEKVQLTALRVDVKKKTIEIDGVFCIGEYPLELLACQGTLRDYEAMVSSPCKPSHLHAALLALGLRPRVRDKKDPAIVLREGDRIDVLIRFTRHGDVRTLEPRELIIDLETKQHIKATPFVFYGSFLFPDPANKGRMIYLGDAEQWLIGLLGDTASVIDLPPGAAGKYGSLAIDTDVAPPQGGRATLIIRPGKPRKPQEPAKAAPAEPKREAGTAPREIRIVLRTGGTKAEPTPELSINGEPAKDWDVFDAALAGLAKAPGALNAPVVLEVSEGARHGWVMRALDALNQLRFRNIQFKQ